MSVKDRLNQPLGVRLNNPGNLEWGSPWQGLVPREESYYFRNGGNAQQIRFCEFKDAAFGIRAIAITLMTYYDKRKANDGSRIDTILEVVERWAPSFENNVQAYAEHISRNMGGLEVTEIIDFNDYDVMRGLVTGIIAHENAGYRYPDKVVEEGLRRAGFVKPQVVEPKQQVPVNVETVAGAAAPIAIGSGQAASVLPDVIESISSQQANLTSGEWVKITVALVLIGLGVAVVLSQRKRRQAGAV